MATQTIEEYLPKTAVYINETFNTVSDERGGHHNYVVTQNICNATTCLIDQSVAELKEFDIAQLNYLIMIDIKH